MPTSRSIKLFSIFGIRIGVDVSWFFVLFLFIFLLSDSFQEVLGGSPTRAYLIAVISVLLFFLSLVLHELGHALVARKLGIGISGIDLWFFGGIAKMTRDTDSPGAEFKVAIAGPIVTAAIIGVCIGIGFLVGPFQEFTDAASLNSTNIEPAFFLLSWLATVNAVLLLFNLIPAFPLDGGRVARSIIWKFTGDRLKATRWAATLGQAFALVLIGLGIFRLLTGSLIGGLWLIILAFFLRQAARASVLQTEFSTRLAGVTVEDIMEPDPVAIKDTTTIADAEEEYFLRYRWDAFPVVDEGNKFIGVIQADAISQTPKASRNQLHVRDVAMTQTSVLSVQKDLPLEKLLAFPPLKERSFLSVVETDGQLCGTVTVDQVSKVVYGVIADKKR